MSSTLTAIFYGVEIPETLLAAEMQHHRAASMKESRTLAGRALASKAVLLARGEALDLEPIQELNEKGHQETFEEALIRDVLSEEVEPDTIDPKAVRKIYDDQPSGFSTPPLLEASHILIAPREDNEECWDAAKAQAQELLKLLENQPKKFFNMAKTVSACPSRSDGGSLGQLRPGDVLSEIWEELLRLELEELAQEPVKTEHGWHVLRLDHRVDGRRLPFEHVRGHIESQLEVRAWTLAAAKYVDNLLRANTSKAPSLAMSPLGELDAKETGVGKIHTVLGDVFAHPSQALSLLNEEAQKIVRERAKKKECQEEEILALAVPAFVNSANDDAWTQIVSCLRESETPLEDALTVILKQQYPGTSKLGHVLDIGFHGTDKPPKEKCHDHCC